MKKITNIIIGIPNIPFLIVVILHTIFKTYKENGVVETSIMEDSGGLTDFLVKQVKRIYPKELSFVVASVFYITLIINI